MRKPAPPPQPAKGLRAYTVPYAAKGGDGPRVYIVSPSYWSDYNAPGAMDCATVANCVLLVGQAVARLVFESPDRPLQRLLSKPNDWQSRTDFMSGLVHSVLMYGNGYMHRPEIGASLLDPGTVTVHPGPTGRPRYHAGGRVYGTREVVHFRDLTAPDNKGGVGSFGHVVKSRLKPLWPRVCALMEADRRINTTFRKGINASAVVEIPADVAVDKELQDEVRKEIEEHYSGSGSEDSGGILMLRGGVLKQLGTGSASDTDLRALRQDLIREIAAAFGVPPFSVGGSGDVKFSNVVARNAQFFQNAVLPVADALKDRLELAFDTTVSYDPERLMKGDFLHQAEVATRAAGGAVLTPKQAAKLYYNLDQMAEGADQLRGASEDLPSNEGDRRDERPDDGSGSEAEAAA